MSQRFFTSVHFVVCSKCGTAVGLDLETLEDSSNMQLLC